MPFQVGQLKFPKVELHLHLDGAVRLETMIEIAKRDGIELPAWTVPALHDDLGCGSIRQSLADYLRAFGYTTAVMQTRENLTRIARELMEDLAADGVDYAEVRFCPTLHVRKGLKPEEVIEAVLEGLERGAEYRLDWGLIICDLRHFDVKETAANIDAALAYKNKGVVAVDLAGDDLNFAALDHAPHFQRAKSGGLRVTIHAGEAGGAERIREALDLFGAERLGHGTKLITDERLLEEVQRREIGIEACPTSNEQTRSWDDLAKHPVREYLKRGLLVSLNSDNPVLGDSSVTHEYEVAAQAWKLTPEEQRTLAHNAVRTAFCDEATRKRLMEIK